MDNFPLTMITQDTEIAGVSVEANNTFSWKGYVVKQNYVKF